MKKIIGILVIVIFLFAICILEEICVSDTLNTIKQTSEKLYELSNQTDNVNTEEIINLTTQLKEFWKEKEVILCYFINYKDMGEMSNEIIRMISYSKNNIKEEYTTSLSLVLYYCETFNHITGFNMQNIF